MWIMMKSHDDQPHWYNKPKRTPAEQNARNVTRQVALDNDRSRLEGPVRGRSGTAHAMDAPRGSPRGKDERKERVVYNMMDIIISSFKRLLGEALRVVKPKYIMIEVATKIAVYKTRIIMDRAVW